MQATEQILPKTYQLPQQQQSNSVFQQQQQIPIQQSPFSGYQQQQIPVQQSSYQGPQMQMQQQFNVSPQMMNNQIQQNNLYFGGGPGYGMTGDDLTLLKPRDENKKVVAIIVSFCSGMTYDNLFTSV